jgi:hypothetical protein
MDDVAIEELRRLELLIEERAVRPWNPYGMGN